MKNLLAILAVGLFSLMLDDALAGHTGQPQEAEFGQIMIMGSDGWTKLDPTTGSVMPPTEKELNEKSRPWSGPLRSMGHEPGEPRDADRQKRNKR